jgi:uncharacterized protein (DUF1778 family)
MRTGRPPKATESKRETRICIRVTEEQKRKLAEVAKKMGISQTNVLLTGLDMVCKDILQKKNNG